MTYQYNIQELAKGVSLGHDHIGNFITLALAERLEALVFQEDLLNRHMQILLVKMDELVTATTANDEGKKVKRRGWGKDA